MLEELAPNIGLIPGGVNIGVVRTPDGSVLLIDTGLDDSAAKRTLKVIREAGWGEVRAILTTHGHADHFGGNATVVKRTSATVYAPELDELFLRHPLMQSVLLFGGADPITALRSRFLLAQPSPVHHVLAVGHHDILGVNVEVIPLPGHSPGQVGYRFGDVCFCADIVLPLATLEKYGIPYLFNLDDHRQSLDRARQISASIFIPGHGEPMDGSGLQARIAQNLDAIDRVASAIVDLCQSPQSHEELSVALLERLSIEPVDAPTLYLLLPSISAILSHLERRGQIMHQVIGGRAIWSNGSAANAE